MKAERVERLASSCCNALPNLFGMCGLLVGMDLRGAREHRQRYVGKHTGQTQLCLPLLGGGFFVQ
jgi:hypothetical protein